MSESDLAGASLPEGIEVDEAAAYFGIVESSASLHTLLEMESTDALCLFLEMTSDLHLAKGEFDFETASQRMNCEGGEIYYLVAGHLGLMQFSDPLRRFLGFEDSEGEPGGPDPGLDAEDSATLLELTDSMTLLRVLSIGFQHGGADAVKKYIGGIATRFSDPAAYLEELKLIFSGMSAVLHSFQNGGEVAPIPGLAESSAMTIAGALDSVSLPSASPPPTKTAPTATPSAPVTKPPEKPASVQKVEPSAVPLPGATPPPAAPLKVLKPLSTQPQPTDSPVPLPAQSMPAVVDERKEIDKEIDAFAGAFGLAPVNAPQSATTEVSVEETVAIPKPISGDSAAIMPNAGSTDIEPESLAGISMENMLQSISTSGHTIPAKQTEEPAIVQAEPAPIQEHIKPQISEVIEQLPEPEELVETVTDSPSQSLVDDDGLPRPVRAAPIRSPVSEDGIQQGQNLLAAQQAAAQQQAMAAQQAAAQQAAAQQQAIAAQQAAAQQAAAQQQAMAAQQAAAQQAAAQQAQQAAQAYQPTIRSGVHCQGCGIGLDPTWNHCPVCGMGKA